MAENLSPSIFTPLIQGVAEEARPLHHLGVESSVEPLLDLWMTLALPAHFSVECDYKFYSTIVYQNGGKRGQFRDYYKVNGIFS